MPEMNDGASGAAASTHNNPITNIKVLYISYNTDHRVLRNKRDDWKNPQTAAEQDVIAKTIGRGGGTVRLPCHGCGRNRLSCVAAGPHPANRRNAR